jgi:hypothetical protein
MLSFPSCASWPALAPPVGAENYVTSRDLRIFVDQSAEPVTPQDADVGT